MEGRRRSGTTVKVRRTSRDCICTSALGHIIPHLVSFVGPFINMFGT